MNPSSAWSIKGITYSALFGALLVALSFVQIHLGFSPVPISMANFAIMLAGALLGARYGFISIGAVVVLTAIGLPLLHGAGGIGFITGRTGGFVWAYPFMALFIGYFASRIQGKGWTSFILLFLVIEVGSLLLYLTGVPWLAHVAHYTTYKALTAGCFPFLPGDAIKALVAAIVVHQVRVYYPAGLLGSSNRPVAKLQS
ncbi:biotin transporter BioY [Paenibacillus koleovorans]|uniref:biotin transporter BioY n=1 Tax=Paenibacillus koleovorans TaxID=121608 RepID=UPI000FDCB68C|nr:biotin transporter BioY [Paenibacillus koleovorans]